VSEDWVEKLIREYQDRITRGAYEAVWRLEPDAREQILRAQARSCVDAFSDLYAIEGPLELDAFLQQMALGGSSKIKIQRDGNCILWEEEHAGECMCPLVKRKAIELNRHLCGCAVNWLRMLIERHTGRRVEVELVNSVADGSRNCLFKITLLEQGPGER